MADTKPLHQKRFEAAVSVIQSLPKNGSFQPSNEMMLKFYSFYKQATQGPCNIPRPAFWDPVGRYKWDAWNSLGDMTKEDAMVAYVDEMKKILESMPMTEKVEELLQVIGPFYEIVEDKKHGRGSGVTSELSTALTSTPNCKAVNGKAESSDSGAESEEENTGRREEEEEEEDDDDEGETEQSEQEEKTGMPDSAPEPCPGGTVANGLLINHSYYIPDIPNHSPTKSDLNKMEEEVTGKQHNTEDGGSNDVDGKKDNDCTEDVAAMQHLTSDSDSEIFCDSMEQFGQEDVDHSQLIEEAMLTEGSSDVWAGGEVKDGGEDGKASGRTPQKEKSGQDKAEYYSSRRGRANRMHPVGEGSRGGQMGNGGDGGDRRGSDRGPNSSLNEHIAVVLTRLQEDMQNVLQRLQTLEALTASQARSIQLESNFQQLSNQKPSWWPFKISSGTLAFAIVWPFVAHWLIHLYLQRKRRKPT
ncbi:PREDICTED: acyl-CoA-binding domain-containing protein 5 isoform X2 [Nanorana parkeri]|uniref:acyl-CoA-binding domain-containing protein 5 isoform X2 n=1 Tax=Nanorana parkeri TaxID=125878 RepID=UPI0008547934|nr:PREDICTED: acyl-CoA-binding domain-containing protein 5 isoform X2 [Nanorana parkeri]